MYAGVILLACLQAFFIVETTSHKKTVIVTLEKFEDTDQGRGDDDATGSAYSLVVCLDDSNILDDNDCTLGRQEVGRTGQFDCSTQNEAACDSFAFYIDPANDKFHIYLEVLEDDDKGVATVAESTHSAENPTDVTLGSKKQLHMNVEECSEDCSKFCPGGETDSFGRFRQLYVSLDNDMTSDQLRSAIQKSASKKMNVETDDIAVLLNGWTCTSDSKQVVSVIIINKGGMLTHSDTEAVLREVKDGAKMEVLAETDTYGCTLSGESNDNLCVPVMLTVGIVIVLTLIIITIAIILESRADAKQRADRRNKFGK